MEDWTTVTRKRKKSKSTNKFPLQLETKYNSYIIQKVPKSDDSYIKQKVPKSENNFIIPSEESHIDKHVSQGDSKVDLSIY